MSFLRRLRRRRAPFWAPFFTGGEHERFLAVLRAEMHRRGWTFDEDEDGLIVHPPAFEHDQEFGLANLAQLCHLAGEPAWPEVIGDHFTNLLKAHEEDTPQLEAWDNARPLLKLRLFGPQTVLPDRVVTYPVARGLVATLALDLPTTVRILNRTTTEHWPPVDELYRAALENTLAEDPPDAVLLREAEAPTTFLSGDSMFVASRALALPGVVDLAGAAGAFFAVPNRHTLMVHAIRDARAVPALYGMIAMAHDLHRDGPGSIIATVYWWHAGAMTPIEASFDGKQVAVTPPDGLGELLESVGASPPR